MKLRKQKAIEFDQDFPPFPGFGKRGFKFLREIKRNNVREWLTSERKQVYQVHLAEPMRLLLAELRERFQAEGLPYSPDPARNMFRLYRDIRFSKNKLPFKTNIGAVIPYRDEKNEGLGGYIHIEPGNSFYGCGSYMPEPRRLKSLRSSIDRDADTLRAIIARLRYSFGDIHGEQLKRSPVGYDETHPAIDLLRYKQMWAFRLIPDSLAGSRELVDWMVQAGRDTLEFNAYLYDVFHNNLAAEET